jgi:hypothetical protein
MIDKINGLATQDYNGLLIMSSISLVFLLLLVQIFLKAMGGYGMKFRLKEADKNGFIEPKKTSSAQRRNIWLLLIVTFLSFLFCIYRAFSPLFETKIWPS